MADPCEEFLSTPVCRDHDEARRQAVLARTLAVVRHRRRLKRFGFAAAFAACYLAGLGTMWLPTRSSWGSNASPVGQVLPPAPREGESDRTATRTDQDSDTPAIVLEWQALDSPNRQPELFRRAGRRYLEETGDLASALRCYQHYLDAGADRVLAISTEDDDFLLMALKAARKERAHVQTDG